MKKWKVLLNHKGEITTHYTHSATRMAALMNAVSQLSDQKGYISNRPLRLYFLYGDKDNYKIEEVQDVKKEQEARGSSTGKER